MWYCVVMGKMILEGVYLTENSDREVESAEQDQTTSMCGLIMLYKDCKKITLYGNLA